MQFLCLLQQNTYLKKQYLWVLGKINLEKNSICIEFLIILPTHFYTLTIVKIKITNNGNLFVRIQQ